MTRRRDRKAIKEPPRTSADIVPLPWVARRKRPASKRQATHTGDPDDYPISDRTLLTVGVFIAFLVIASVWLLETMRRNATLEECLMAGRKNCTPPIAAPIVER